MSQTNPVELTPDSTELFDAQRHKGEPKVRDFDLKAHLAKTARADSALHHIRIGLENWLATKIMQQAVRGRPKVPDEYLPRWGQYKQIERESHSMRTKRRQLVVFAKMPFMGGLTGDSDVDFMEALKDYEFLDYPNHYLQPFHSLPGGWLSPLAASANEPAMRALFAPATRGGCEGLRQIVAEQVPTDAEVVYDFGCCRGEQGKFFADRLGPNARIVCVDPSPFGIILGKAEIKDPRIEWVHDFAERADLPDNSGDAVNIFFLLHETPNHIKQEILNTAFRVLKPGGKVIISEPPLWDLEQRSGGFFEPFRVQWIDWDGRRMLENAGFTQIIQEDVADSAYVHGWNAKKPS